jgi:hypothetical protein
MFFHCFNCGVTRPFWKFIKEIDPRLYDEFRLESLRENGRVVTHISKDVTESPIAPRPKKVLDGLVPILEFDIDHPIRRYVNSRMIPEDRQSELFYCRRFMEWVNTILPGKFESEQLKRDEPRLIIPFIDRDGYAFAVAGRSFKKTSIKYITIKFDENVDKVYGLYRVDPARRVYTFEGPIDSMFIDNSIAMAGSSGRIPEFDDNVIVLDNEPRSREIVRLNEKFIEAGRTVCIWPIGLKEKDVNEQILSGKSADEIKNIIDTHAVRGLTAKIKLSEWRIA